MKTKKQKPLLGWREWVSLPDLRVKNIKVKIDTGARTSALHANDIEFIKRGSKKYVRFRIYPIQRSHEKSKIVEMRYIEKRKIKSSTGNVTVRPVIETFIRIGDDIFPIELTLVNRDIMGFRMLLGRQAMRNRYIIDPGKSFITRRYDPDND